MHMNIRTLVLLFGFAAPSLLWAQRNSLTDATLPTDETFIQRLEQYNVTENIRPLRLNDVIEQGLRKNHDQEIRRYRDSLLEIDWKDTRQAFWLPELSLELSTTPQRVGVLRGDRGAQTDRFPMGNLSLSISDYTIFNWGKDYLLYLNQQASYQRQKERLFEERRELRQQLTIAFLELLQLKESERLAGDQLRHASFIYRLNREKVAVNRVTRQEYYQARSEYLRAQTEFHQARIDAQVAEEKMAYMIQDPPGTRYIVSDEIIPTPIKITLEEAIRLARERNPGILNRKQELGNAQRLHDLRLRENLPLPRFSVDLGAWTYRFSPDTHATRYGTSAGLTQDPSQQGNQIEIVASVNARWSLVGRGGLLNSRTTERSQLSQNLAYRRLSQAESESESFVHELFKRVVHWQNQLQILEARTPTLQRNFDTILENYMNGRTSFVDYKVALEEMTHTAQLLEFTRYSHARDKILLAQEIGIEDFPGENMENLVRERRRRTP
jgi:outer membrane protein TolC